VENESHGMEHVNLSEFCAIASRLRTDKLAGCIESYLRNGCPALNEFGSSKRASKITGR
jgi:hypothetical protein